MIFLGKEVIKVGVNFIYGEPIYYDYSKVRYTLVVGKRGTGKSFTLGVLLEGFAEANNKELSVIVFDTLNIFHTLQYPNYRGIDLLSEWNLEPKKFAINMIEPTFSKEDLSFYDLLEFFSLEETDPKSDIIYEHFINNKEPPFLKQRYKLLKSLLGPSIIEKIKNPGIHIIRVGHLPIYAKRAVLNILARKILEIRIKEREKEIKREASDEYVREVPLFWLFIDEAHEFLDKSIDSPVKDSLVNLIREGRGPGVGLVLATQQPNKLIDDALTQIDSLIAHRLTNKSDIESISSILYNYIDIDFRKYFAINLPNRPGAALFVDDEKELVKPIQVRPRMSYHGGSTAHIYKI
ncbi:NEQ512 [Nanoarchaeum equitans Kin4-M]|uniref:NEQ512 n=1 Tax=Nanoarchaeum equitans (strain Kin4-M) TaxID=228908 RepID=Q74MW9_NANEQ|nr:NEQ512 [Nanoarchaeum equitans Kin4-M]